jgi:2-oxoglutarate dehydrogenase E1 component
MCDDDPDMVPEMDPKQRTQIQMANWQIVNASTPANYFHVLRRQVHRDFRKPLVLMTPKSLLRHSACKSPLVDFSEGSRFQRLIPDSGVTIANPAAVKTLVFCSGKVYYDLHQERAKQHLDNVAIARVEQISPFPFDKVAKEALKYPNAEIVWTQEESKNMGAWAYVQPRFATALKYFNKDSKRASLRYCGRGPSASPATGSATVHRQEQDALIADTLK